MAKFSSGEMTVMTEAGDGRAFCRISVVVLHYLCLFRFGPDNMTVILQLWFYECHYHYKPVLYFKSLPRALSRGLGLGSIQLSHMKPLKINLA